MNTVRQQRHFTVGTRRALAGIALGVLAQAAAPGAARAPYAFTKLDVPGAVATYADGNSSTRIVGEFDDENGDTHGFIRTPGGGFKQYDVPGSVGWTSINGINASGERSGIYGTEDGRFHGFFWSHGEVKTLDPPDTDFSIAAFLNNKGQVVGFARKGTEPRQGFMWHKDVFTPINVPEAGPRGTRPSGINDRGQIVGAYYDTQDGGRLRGFLYDKGTYTRVDVPGTENGFTYAQGINNGGLIVGYYAKNDDDLDHGFVLSRHGYTTVDVPGADWTDIYSVNAAGDIVGAYEDETGVHGFRGTPAGRLEPDPVE
jgi:uncharacterized membrane protein